METCSKSYKEHGYEYKTQHFMASLGFFPHTNPKLETKFFDKLPLEYQQYIQQ